jgi:hypothetical protein
LSARDAARAFRLGQQRGEHDSHWVHHGRFVHAVPFLIVDLITVDECGGARRDPLSGAPDPRVLTASPGGGESLKFVDQRHARARQSDSDRVQYEYFGGIVRRLGERLVTRLHDVFHEAVGE